MMMWGTPSPSAKLTDDSGSAFEAPLIGDCRLFRSWARNQPPRFLGLLQQYLPIAAVPNLHSRKAPATLANPSPAPQELDRYRLLIV
jgi:hypothetical protein